MNLLAIDTSTDACSVAVMVNGETLFDHRVAAQRHGEWVLGMVDELMVEAGITPAQLDALVFGQGPGSFTGVRIGVAAAQGIALGADIGVVGISTLQSIAQGTHRESGDSSVAVCVDARMDEVYFCEFSVNQFDVMQAIVDEQICKPEIVAWQESNTWAGSGAERYAQHLEQSVVGASICIRANSLPQARDLLHLGAVRVKKGDVLPAELARPVYLRNKVALTTEERLLGA